MIQEESNHLSELITERKRVIWRNVSGAVHKKVFLKNNKECLLRNDVESDAEEIHKIFNLTHAQTDFLCTYLDEDLFDIEQEHVFLSKMEQSANEIEICAVVGGYIVGTAGVKAIGKKIKSSIVRNLESVLKKDFGALELVML